MDTRVPFLVLSLLAVTLAGCTEPTDTADGAIKILGMPTDPATEPLRLESTVTADEYKWKMGDGRVPLTTKTVEHVYGVTDGKFRIELTTVKGGVPTTHAILAVEFGTGTNSAPTFEFGLENNWIQVGEEVSFTAAGTVDTEGDPLLLQWFCQRKSDIAVSTEGGHPPPPGVGFGSGAASAFPVVMLNGTVPAADRTVTGDLCDNIGTGGFAEETTVRGAFATPGIYEITMAAKDPANPNVASAATLYVTDFPRVEGPVSHTFADTIQYGAPKEYDSFGEAAEQSDHIRSHDFVIEYPIVSVSAIITEDGGAVSQASDIQFEIRKGASSKFTGSPSEPLVKDSAFLTPGSYTAWVFLRSGMNVGYSLEVEYVYETDPAKLFEAPHA